MGIAVADERLLRGAGRRRKRHRYVHLPARREAEVDVLAQKLGRESHMKVEVHQGGGLVAGEHAPEYAVIDELEESVARHARFLREDRDLAQRLYDHAQVHVVTDLRDARKLAFAYVTRAATHDAEVGLRRAVRFFRA